MELISTYWGSNPSERGDLLADSKIGAAAGKFVSFCIKVAVITTIVVVALFWYTKHSKRTDQEGVKEVLVATDRIGEQFDVIEASGVEHDSATAQIALIRAFAEYLSDLQSIEEDQIPRELIGEFRALRSSVEAVISTAKRFAAASGRESSASLVENLDAGNYGQLLLGLSGAEREELDGELLRAMEFHDEAFYRFLEEADRINVVRVTWYNGREQYKISY